MRVKIGLITLLLSALVWTPGTQVLQNATVARLDALESAPTTPASVTVAPEAPVVVTNAAAANNRGWAGSQLTPAPEDLTGDVLAAYTLAVAISPTQCHLTTPLLAAIGQVESGNLAGHNLDGHRVSPAILGPVLDGKPFRAVADTDAGTWDGNTRWDRALGPMQIIPSSWRVVGLDMDGDGVRDPQNIYDSAGAAMGYLCAGGRDLSTADGLRAAVLSYNRSPAYLKAVLAWASVFEKADLSGSGAVPFEASLVMPTSTPLEAPLTTTATTPFPQSSVQSSAAPHPVAAAPVTKARPATPGATATPTQTPAASGKPSATGTPSPSTGAPTPSGPAASDPPASEEPSKPAGPEPTKPADPEPTKPADPVLPECPVPTPSESAEPSPSAEPTEAVITEDGLVVSPETCTPPEGYEFDPETDLLVLIPVTDAP